MCRRIRTFSAVPGIPRTRHSLIKATVVIRAKKISLTFLVCWITFYKHSIHSVTPVAKIAASIMIILKSKSFHYYYILTIHSRRY
ncbi:hypothetical protein TRIP_B40194 [uncultured Desulfatiglans sp.]|nr:hypothetical protein TRIP_B40194 [uncultured Desulfatiglans sp.]